MQATWLPWLWAALLQLLAQAAPFGTEAPPRDQEAWNQLMERLCGKRKEIASQLDSGSDSDRVQIRTRIVEAWQIAAALRGSLLSLHNGEDCGQENATTFEMRD